VQVTPRRLRESAHALKGSVATVGGAAGRQAAARLEDLGKSGKLETAGRSACEPAPGSGRTRTGTDGGGTGFEGRTAGPPAHTAVSFAEMT
jgi:HPt (histidine-containing phosphotransfer) domain-containing protein